MRSPRVLLTALALVLVAAAPALWAQTSPVTVTVGGDAVPGGTVTATMATTDGSTITSVTWAQTYGVSAALSGTDTATVTAVLGSAAEYKAFLIHVLQEPPLGADDLPPNVPVPEEEFANGLQDRFQVVGLNPYALEEALRVELTATVVTSSGTYTATAAIHTTSHLKWTSGISNVAIGIPVMLGGKTQGAYDWTLTAPNGSAATLVDATSQYPEFIPDVNGRYDVAVTHEAAGEMVTLSIYAGAWIGMITGQDENGRPVVDQSCRTCHGPIVDLWANTGHAEIFTNSLDTNTHYGTSCMACHTVGLDTDVANGGFDDAPDYQAFLDSGLINNPGDNWTTMLEQFPNAARLANIQCESCHGPQNSQAHTVLSPLVEGTRVSLSSDMCAYCHGEPPRHGRFQQWQLSAHANYELAGEEGMSGSCSKCHSANGFLAWLPILMGEEPGDPNANVPITWTEDQIHPQTCQTCHDPHDVGLVSGDGNDSQTRIYGDTPMLMAGFMATDVGNGAICMTCHNTRRGLKNDTTWDPSDASRAPHSGAQADVLMGQNAYLVEVGTRSYHSRVEDSCAECHMQSTPPPDIVSYNRGGTNHTFYASPDICQDCHSVIQPEDVQGPVEQGMHELQAAIEDAILDLMEAQIALGHHVEIGDAADITAMTQIADIEFTESHGRQAIAATLADGTMVEATSMNDVYAVTSAGDATRLYDLADAVLPKSGWNYLLLHSDGSHGVHHPDFANAILTASSNALASIGAGGGAGTGGVGPVSCTSAYVYWTEIASRGAGLAGSVWRTDVAAKNVADTIASVEFILHTNSGEVRGSNTIGAGEQGVFEDLVGALGGNAKGALEICSDRPLQVVSRIYNFSDEGTFGQFVDGFSGGGLVTGDIAKLIGLRQLTGAFRTNLSFTNAGTDEAAVEVTLYSTNGTELVTYEQTIPSGMVVQDVEPFRTRGNAPDMGWGYASVKVTAGRGVVTSASVVDMQTNDPTTISMKR